MSYIDFFNTLVTILIRAPYLSRLTTGGGKGGKKNFSLPSGASSLSLRLVNVTNTRLEMAKKANTIDFETESIKTSICSSSSQVARGRLACLRGQVLGPPSSFRSDLTLLAKINTSYLQGKPISYVYLTYFAIGPKLKIFLSY
jgi:hypothetical protein